MISKSKRIITILSIVAVILLVPLIGMQLSTDISWGISDFVVMGILLLIVGFLSEFVLRNVKTTKFRILILGLILLLFLFVWAELAVGVFGTPFAGN